MISPGPQFNRKEFLKMKLEVDFTLLDQAIELMGATKIENKFDNDVLSNDSNNIKNDSVLETEEIQ